MDGFNPEQVQTPQARTDHRWQIRSGPTARLNSSQQFQRGVAGYGGDYKVRSFDCRNQFLCLSFAQFTCRESLRDIEACLRSRRSQLYHLGLHGEVSRATLADANEARDWRIYADLAQGLNAGDELGAELDQTDYAMDAATIYLCLSLFPWAGFRTAKVAIKMNTRQLCGTEMRTQAVSGKSESSSSSPSFS